MTGIPDTFECPFGPRGPHWSPGLILNENSQEKWDEWLLTLNVVKDNRGLIHPRVSVIFESEKTGTKFESSPYTFYYSYNFHGQVYDFWHKVWNEPSFSKHKESIMESMQNVSNREKKAYLRNQRKERKERNEKEAAELGITVKELIVKRKEISKEKAKQKKVKKQAKAFVDQVNLTGQILKKFTTLKEDFDLILENYEKVIAFIQREDLNEEQRNLYVTFLRREQSRTRFYQDARWNFRNTNSRLKDVLENMNKLGTKEEEGEEN